MSFINSIRSAVKSTRNSLARAIAAPTTITPVTPKDEFQETMRRKSIIDKQYNRLVVHNDEPLRGSISTNDIGDFVSDYTKAGICSLGSWSALARAYNLFVKNPKDQAIDKILSEFHAWNAVNPQQMDEQAVLDTCARLSQVQPAKGNDTTDAIIARVRKVSVAEVAASRQAKAAADTAKREALLEQFITAVWSHVYDENTYYMPALKAEGKLVNIMEWVANWNSNNPAAQASELLLIEDDLKLVRKIGSEDRGNTEQFVDGVLTADHMMTLAERQSA